VYYIVLYGNEQYRSGAGGYAFVDAEPFGDAKRHTTFGYAKRHTTFGYAERHTTFGYAERHTKKEKRNIGATNYEFF
jgi:hypothetical protein